MAGDSPNILSGRLSPDDPRRVKDSAILNYAQLGGLDIVKGELVVEREYTADNPFSRIYGIDKGEFAGQMMQAFKGTRKVRADGRVIIPAWVSHNGGYEIEESNIISGSVGSDGRIICADRTTQRGATWNPVVTLDGEVVPIKGGITFPAGHWRNVKHPNSVIDIDYGICTRRIEILQGQVLESWIFYSNPDGTVRIVHNHSGDSDRFELPSYYAVDDDVEEITQEDFEQGGRYKVGYPLIAQASLPVGMHGYASRPNRSGVSETWAGVRGGAGTDHNHTQTWLLIQAESTSQKWKQIVRYHGVYDTSALGAGATISAVTEKYWGKTAGEGAKQDPLNCTPALCVVQSLVDDITDIDNADYALAEFGVVRGATDISYAAFTAGEWNTHTYNATGRGWVNKTGYTAVGHRLDNDQDNVAPTWAGSEVYSHLSWAHQGDVNEPVMTITYTSVVAPTVLTVTPAINITGEAARISGNVTATGGQNPTRYLQYGKTTGYELGSLNKGVGGTGIYLHDLSGLDAGTLYYFRAYATNTGGTGYGAQADFTTLSDIDKSLSASFQVAANNERKLTLQAFISIETESSMGRKLGFPLSALLELEAETTLHIGIFKSLSVSFEIEAEAGRKLVFPLSSLLEVEAVAPLQLLKALSVLIEIEAEAGKLLKFPLSSLIEMEAEAVRKLILPLSALIEVEAVGTFRAGLEKSISVSLEVEAEGGKLLKFPLSALIEVEAVAGRHLIKPLSALIEVEAVGELALLIPMVRKQQLLLEITTEEQVTH